MSDRRAFLNTLSLTLASGAALGAEQEDSPSGDSSLPPGARLPKLDFVYECDVRLADTLDFGKTIDGHRRIFPITGGTFRGPRIRGEVLSGGADWNLQRTDGAGSVEAAYYLRTDDGVLIRIVNEGVGLVAPPAADSTEAEQFFMFTNPSFEAPTGKYDWLNREMFIGTLGARSGVRNAVLIRVFRLV